MWPFFYCVAHMCLGSNSEGQRKHLPGNYRCRGCHPWPPLPFLFSSLPTLFRHLHHNVFERTHRFSGWTALGLLWAFIILTISHDAKTKSYSADLKSKLIKQQEFWFTLAITVLIIIPWLTVRRVPVKISAPSGHAAIIQFQGGVKAGVLGRISPSPFSE